MSCSFLSFLDDLEGKEKCGVEKQKIYPFRELNIHFFVIFGHGAICL